MVKKGKRKKKVTSHRTAYTTQQIDWTCTRAYCTAFSHRRLFQVFKNIIHTCIIEMLALLGDFSQKHDLILSVSSQILR